MGDLRPRLLAALLLTFALGAEARAQGVYERTLAGTGWVRAGKRSGSGWVVDKERRLLVTNHHVVRDNKTVRVQFPLYRNGRVVAERGAYRGAGGVAGRVIAVDKKRDLALVQLASLPVGVRALKIAARAPSPGSRVHSIGNPGRSGALW